MGYNPEREWKNIPLPRPSAADTQSVQPVSIPEELVKKAQNQHDVLCKWMKTAGTDLCKGMEDTENQFVWRLSRQRKRTAQYAKRSVITFRD